MSLYIESFEIGPFPNNLYLLIDQKAREVVVIDPSIDSDAAIARIQELEKEGITLKAIWNTHGHLDHVYDNERWKELFPVPISMHQDDVFLLEHLREQAIWLGLPQVNPVTPDLFFEDGQTVSIGQHTAQVLHTPGHSPGSVSLYFADEKIVFVGDVLFRGSVGRTDLPGCSSAQLQESLKRLAALPADTRVLTGHGEETTIADELATNPYLDFLR